MGSQNQTVHSQKQNNNQYDDMSMQMRNGVNENRANSFQSNRGNSMGNRKTVADAKKQRKEYAIFMFICV